MNNIEVIRCPQCREFFEADSDDMGTYNCPRCTPKLDIPYWKIRSACELYKKDKGLKMLRNLIALRSKKDLSFEDIAEIFSAENPSDMLDSIISNCEMVDRYYSMRIELSEAADNIEKIIRRN